MKHYDAIFLTGVCHPNSFNRAQGAYRLAHILRSNGYSVRVIDGVGSLESKHIVDMIDCVITSHTKLFCISSTFFSNLDTSIHTDSLVTKEFLPYPLEEWMSIINKVKARSTAKIIVGGHKTNEFEQNKNIHNYIEHFIYGYADEIILDLMKEETSRVKINNTSLITSDQYNIFATKYDPLDSFLPGEAFTIEMQRGCMFKCSFCAYPMNGKKKGTFTRDTNLLVDELVYCYDNFGSTNFILNSDTFNDSNEYLESFHNALTKTNIKFNFGVNARLDLFYKNNDMIHLCKEIGVRSILFGLESSNPFSLKEIGKGLPFDKVVDTLHICKSIWQEQTRMTGSYIIGLPQDTEDNINQINNFFSSKDCPLHSIEFDPLYVYNSKLDTNPWQSEYTINAEQHGFIFKDNSLSNWTNDRTPYKTFQRSVIRAEELLGKLPDNKKSTIKSAAYMHLPNNYPGEGTAQEKFEEVFKFTTYREYSNYLKTIGKTITQARNETAKRYYNLFLNNNR